MSIEHDVMLYHALLASKDVTGIPFELMSIEIAVSRHQLATYRHWQWLTSVACDLIWQVPLHITRALYVCRVQPKGWHQNRTMMASDTKSDIWATSEPSDFWTRIYTLACSTHEKAPTSRFPSKWPIPLPMRTWLHTYRLRKPPTANSYTMGVRFYTIKLH